MIQITNWQTLCFRLGKMFGIDVDFEGVLMLIGVRTMEWPLRSFSKEEKMNLINLGACVLYETVGLTRKVGVDREGWPIFEQRNISATEVTEESKKRMLKEASIKYFIKIL